MVKARLSQQRFKPGEGHGVVAAMKLMNDRWRVGMLLRLAEGEIVLIAVPPPDLLGGIGALAHRAGAIRMMIGAPPLDRGVIPD